MKCPICDVEMRLAERQGVEIDYCPNCRGVWLDRGELDKLIERSRAAQLWDERDAGVPRDLDRPARPAREPFDYGRDWDDDYPRRKRRKSFLEELFDFD
ncbi:MAG: zf-TFIIB domain-containing protein [Anaerolineae bacterium]|nr:zf-TFIIB domain-containing protein [Candidatus Roseilinea sp.]MDW8448700.1 zf-TFIIB domain-containing protein [Anaerolineae bacterium]